MSFGAEFKRPQASIWTRFMVGADPQPKEETPVESPPSDESETDSSDAAVGEVRDVHHGGLAGTVPDSTTQLAVHAEQTIGERIGSGHSRGLDRHRCLGGHGAAARHRRSWLAFDGRFRPLPRGAVDSARRHASLGHYMGHYFHKTAVRLGLGRVALGAG